MRTRIFVACAGLQYPSSLGTGYQNAAFLRRLCLAPGSAIICHAFVHLLPDDCLRAPLCQGPSRRALLSARASLVCPCTRLAYLPLVCLPS